MPQHHKIALLCVSLLACPVNMASAQQQTQADESALPHKPCEELKSEIEAKLQAKGVEAYTLEIVPNEDVKNEKIVGSCDGGTKKITYQRG
ncbi:MAG: DUF1161 domain-containing protein [Burkholderiales bacterium]